MMIDDGDDGDGDERPSVTYSSSAGGIVGRGGCKWSSERETRTLGCVLHGPCSVSSLARAQARTRAQAQARTRTQARLRTRTQTQWCWSAVVVHKAGANAKTGTVAGSRRSKERNEGIECGFNVGRTCCVSSSAPGDLILAAASFIQSSVHSIIHSLIGVGRRRRNGIQQVAGRLDRRRASGVGTRRQRQQRQAAASSRTRVMVSTQHTTANGSRSLASASSGVFCARVV